MHSADYAPAADSDITGPVGHDPRKEVATKPQS